MFENRVSNYKNHIFGPIYFKFNFFLSFFPFYITPNRVTDSNAFVRSRHLESPYQEHPNTYTTPTPRKVPSLVLLPNPSLDTTAPDGVTGTLFQTASSELEGHKHVSGTPVRSRPVEGHVRVIKSRPRHSVQDSKGKVFTIRAPCGTERVPGSRPSSFRS